MNVMKGKYIPNTWNENGKIVFHSLQFSTFGPNEIENVF